MPSLNSFRQTLTYIGPAPLLALGVALMVFGYAVGRYQDGSVKAAQEEPETAYRTAIHFSPDENLEAVDIPLIKAAKDSVDAAMYSFTDRKLAEALVTAAERGVHVRIYRDHDQFESEQAREGKVLTLLSHQPNIQIRVKASRALMHEKAFEVDGRLLRDGSGNWSLSAAHYQDNEISVTDDLIEANAFRINFFAMWNRSDNEVIQ